MSKAQGFFICVFFLQHFNTLLPLILPFFADTSNNLLFLEEEIKALTSCFNGSRLKLNLAMEELKNTSLKIPQWAEEDRPREKLLMKGRAALSDAELIGILIGSGTVSLSAVDVAKLILKDVSNDLNQLAGLTVEDLKKFRA